MTVVGVDLGGTNVRAATIDARGEVVDFVRGPNQAERGPQTTVRMIGDLVEAVDCPAGDPLRAIGVAVSGPVDVRTGVVDNPFTLAGWPSTNLLEPLRSRFSVPVAVENDANAAAIGEWRMGVGRGSRRFVAVTVGTGIGVGFLIDGIVQRGPAYQHGEAGHHLLDPRGPECYCGARGCWEVLAAGPALARMASERGLELSDGEAVTMAARSGSRAAAEIVKELGTWLGRGLVNVVSFYTPDTIALAGSLADELDLMESTIRVELERHDRLVPTGASELRVANHPVEAGALGAAHLALGSLETDRGHRPPGTDLLSW